MSMFTSTRWAARQTVRAIVEFKGLFLMALSLAGLALTIPFFLATLAWSLSSQVFNVPTQAEVTIFADRSAGEQSVKELAEAISANSVISDVRIMPKEDALAMVNQSLGLKPRINAPKKRPRIIRFPTSSLPQSQATSRPRNSPPQPMSSAKSKTLISLPMTTPGSVTSTRSTRLYPLCSAFSAPWFSCWCCS